MAFFKTAQLFIKSYLRSEIIFHNIVKKNVPISTAVNKYLDELKNLQIDQNNSDLSQFFDFPIRTFYKLNKISLDNIIISSYNIFNEKGLLRNSKIYDVLLECYLKNHVNFDVQSLLKDMNENQVPLSEDIVGKIVNYFSVRGQMDLAEILLNKMKSEGVQCLGRDNHWMVSGYIIAGQPEKAESFINQNRLYIEDHNMFYSRCYGYASIADVAGLKNVLAEMNEKSKKFSTRRYFSLYERLIFGNVEKSDLNEIIDLTMNDLVDINSKLHNLIIYLNSCEQFNYSLFLIEKFNKFIEDGSRHMFTFGTSKCPTNTFKEALKILINRCQIFTFTDNVFGDIKFNVAWRISQEFTANKNWKIINISLINSAINEKSQVAIENAIKFSKKHLNSTECNLLFYKTLPSMKLNGIVSDIDEIIDMFPRFANELVPVVLLKYLCSGDFDNYNKLRLKRMVSKIDSPRFYWNHLAIELIMNLSLDQIKTWSMEASKCFHEKFIRNILSNLVIVEMVKYINNDSFGKIDQLIVYMKDWNLDLSPYITDRLLRLPGKSELIQTSIVAKFNDGKNEVNSAN